jgi:hypothetical protein
MAKVFSVAARNVEHFKDDPSGVRVNRVVDFVAAQSPDVVALFDALMSRMPPYTFQIT